MCCVDLLYREDRWVAILYYAYRWVDQPQDAGPTIVESAWGSGLGQLFALAAGLREDVAGPASALIQPAKMRPYIYHEV